MFPVKKTPMALVYPDSAKEMMCVKLASSLIVHGESHGPRQHIATKRGQKALASAAEVVLSCL